jgi:hypothetical protein
MSALTQNPDSRDNRSEMFGYWIFGNYLCLIK